MKRLSERVFASIVTTLGLAGLLLPINSSNAQTTNLNPQTVKQCSNIEYVINRHGRISRMVQSSKQPVPIPGEWDNGFLQRGYRKSYGPGIGAIVVVDPGVAGASSRGHVGIVTGVDTVVGVGSQYIHVLGAEQPQGLITSPRTEFGCNNINRWSPSVDVNKVPGITFWYAK